MSDDYIPWWIDASHARRKGLAPFVAPVEAAPVESMGDGGVPGAPPVLLETGPALDMSAPADTVEGSG